MERSRNSIGILLLIALIGIGAVYLMRNDQPAVTVSVPVYTATPYDVPPEEWQSALEAQIAAQGTPLPTPDLGSPFVPPTLPPTNEPPPVIQPVEVEVTPYPTSTPRPTLAIPTSDGPTPFPSPTGIAPPEPTDDRGFQPPPVSGPRSAHVNDHFWLERPVAADANSASLFYYAFGSDGPQDAWRVHHGVDMPNPIGQPIRAAGSGIVVFAGDGGEIVDRDQIDIYPAYGNVVVIEHDFGYRGQKLFTLYAHMSSIVTTQGARVQAGDIVGLIGGTGDVSGPHVHLEVRLGANKYFDVLNPLLWIKPYVGHGVVAGRVTWEDGRFIDDVIVTLSQNGRVFETTTTYIKPKTPGQTRDWEVVPDPAWQENFVLGDIPAGTYQISVTVGGRRVERTITVKPETTNFIDLGFQPAATPQSPDETATDD